MNNDENKCRKCNYKTENCGYKCFKCKKEVDTYFHKKDDGYELLCEECLKEVNEIK